MKSFAFHPTKSFYLCSDQLGDIGIDIHIDNVTDVDVEALQFRFETEERANCTILLSRCFFWAYCTNFGHLNGANLSDAKGTMVLIFELSGLILKMTENENHFDTFTGDL